MKSICAWCGKNLGSTEAGLGNEFEHLISHGICEECAKDAFPHESSQLSQFLDSSFPSAAVGNSDDSLEIVNQQASGESRQLYKFLDSLADPVVVVGSDARVKAANRRALKMLGKASYKIEGFCGDVFECEHAKLPEGCGHTIYCGACIIRQAVMTTFETGVSSCRTLATFHQHTTEDSKDFDLIISTEKSGDVVLLKIDSMTEKHGQ